MEPSKSMSTDDVPAPTSPRLSLVPVSQIDRIPGWQPILEASNQVVLRPLHEDIAANLATSSSPSDFQRHGHHTDPHSRVPNYFQLLAQANESSRPTTPGPYGAHQSTSTSSVYLEAEPDVETLFAGNSMAQGYFTAFFREKQRLGMGANGTVLLCEHILDGNVLGEYAVKKVAVGQSHDYLVNILREVRLLEKLRHPNIITYHHAWLESSRFSTFGNPVPTLFSLKEEGGSNEVWFQLLGLPTMECSLDTWIAGRSTSSTLFNDPSHHEDSNEDSKSARIRAFREQQKGHRSSPLPGVRREVKAVHLLSGEELRSLFGDIATGLAYLHDRSILHLDLKPGNILLTFDQGKLIPRAMLSDFGTSRDMLTTRTRSGNTGTLEYAAPETLDAERSVDSKADMWSLGMILHKLLFFRLPYVHDDIAGLEEEISEYLGFKADGDTVNAFARRGLPSPIIYLLQSLLSRDPLKRPTSAQVLSAMTSGKFDPVLSTDHGRPLPVVRRGPDINTQQQAPSPTTPTSSSSPPVSPGTVTKPSSQAEELSSVIMSTLRLHRDERSSETGTAFEGQEEEALILALWRVREARKEKERMSEDKIGVESDGEVTPPSRMMPGGFLAITHDSEAS
ncbi:putative serine/threonine-protein kinase iks1 [Tulasnella sp. 427]|nr:putative serine/threonine-protein kinase iks1 [Tulasnella sp. 427]